MRFAILALIVGVISLSCAQIAVAQAGDHQLNHQPQELPGFGLPADRHKFGVDWHKIQQGPEALKMPAGLDRLIANWSDFPDRAEKAIWQGAAAGAAINVMLAFLAILIVYQVTVRK